MTDLHPLLFLLLVCSLAVPIFSTGVENGFISFKFSKLAANEDSNADFTTVSIPFIREVGSSGDVLVTFEVTNASASDDFLGLTNSATFSDGETESTGFLIIRNDAVPELNETFLIQIIDARSGAEIGSVSTMLLTVRASDDPHGKLQFDAQSLSISVAEPATGQATVQFQVNRGPGLYGQVTADYQISAGPNLGVLDISLTQGQLTFNDQINTTTFTLSVLADDIPENDETFTIQLTNPGGGAVISDTNNQAQLVITSNDSPIRFSTSSFEVSESVGTAFLTVSRGTLQGGTEVGPLSQVTTVQYSTTAGTATAGQDYQESSGTITFPSNSTSQTISIPIINDDSPEGDETFTVTLTSVSSDAVLQSPTVATVIISINDNAGGIIKFQSTATQTISEDAQTSAIYVVQRTGGSLGNITVTYSIKDSSNQLASGDFSPASGTVTILDGETQANLILTAFNDALPEEAEVFTVSIDSVVGGAGELDNQTLRVAMLQVADSDDVYGVIEVAGGSVEVISGQRQLKFQVTRSISNIGQILAQYRILYLSPGNSNPSQGQSGVVAAATDSIQLLNGQTSANVTVVLYSNAFLEENALIYIEVNNTELSGGATPLVTPTLSPRIGSTSSITASIPFSVASGYISFSSNSLTRSTSEPDSGFITLSLTIIRTGGFGTATVTWTTSAVGDSTFDASDVGVVAAQKTINNGASSATVLITILADDVPELNETFNVNLLTVAQPGQQLASNMTTATITILANDNPEGTFFIASASQGPFYIEENDVTFLQITVQRDGGDLTTEQIQYHILPADTSDFIGSTGILTFTVGSRLQIIGLAPTLDGIPEINETFVLEIFSAAGKDILGMPTNVSITILANDDWNGVFNFTMNSLHQYIDEPANPGTIDNSLVTMATFTIQRSVATFGDAVVYWELAADTNDIIPNNGSVIFTEGVNTGSFQISSQSDLITEENITHTVQLVSVMGGGRVSNTGTSASLTVLQNDAPISIAPGDLSKLGSEGQNITFNVIRTGYANGIVNVTFSVTYQTAAASDVIITPSNGVVTLQDGQLSVPINILIIDDNYPELNEELQLQLTGVTGDAVIASANTQATLIISASDDPNGIFQFAGNSLDITSDENTNISLIIERLRGTHGTTIVYWQALFVDPESGVIQPAVPQTDLSVVAGSIVFQDGQSSGAILLEILRDGIPELDEMYMIELINTTGGTPGAIISSTNDTATVTIRENDDPFGIFNLVLNQPRLVWLAEDIPVDDSDNGTGFFNITRTAGTFGDIQAVWEVRSLYSPSLPEFTDLLLKGSVDSGVVTTTSRPSTATKALSFAGSASSLVTVPSDVQPTDLSDGSLSISLWVKMNNSVNGMILAKGSVDGSTIFYGLAVQADDNNYIIRFSYLPSTMNSGFTTVEVSVTQSSLPSDIWHSLILSVNGNKASFYSDGSLVVTRTLASSTIRDSDGTLTIGGLSGSQYFVGSLQDVRVYSTALTQQQVTEISSDAAASDLSYISGVVSLGEGMAESTFSIQTIDDSISEFSEDFQVYLVAVSGKASISDDLNTVELTVLKSDSSNGVFGFSTSSLLPMTTTEGSNVTVTIIRARGTFSSVTVSWEVRSTADGSLATDDFLSATGNVIFDEDDIEQSFSLEIINETVPELDETFTITLTAVVVDDIYPSTTPTSGAWLNISQTETNITVSENDFPYGILQFAESSPISGGNTIPPATEVPQIYIEESVGSVTIYVVRAQGTVGTARVDYATQDGNATSGGVTPDYTPTGGSLTFADGEQVKSFMVTILDNTAPELGKYFFVNLSNPSGNGGAGSPILGVGRDIVININPSDDAYGIFSFSSAYLSQVVTEQQGGTLVAYVVNRGNKGMFGSVSVYWEFENGEQDITPSSGTINFVEGQTAAIFYVTVNNDVTPELHENFTVRLVNTTNGRISDAGDDVALLTIRASDYPFGVFSISSGFRPLVVQENIGTVNVIVTREFGIEGTVQVYYSSIDNAVGNNLASPGEDYLNVSGSVTFAPNETSRSFSVTILDDSIPEIPESFYILLINATLLSDPGIHLGTDTLPIVSMATDANNATIVIDENDNARGIFQLSSATFSASEGDTSAITVSRTAGTYGEVSISWIISLITASANDVTALQGTDIIANGASSAPLSIGIVDDNSPEFDESFVVGLTAISGGASLGSPTLATVTIPTSDDPNGAFVFTEDSRVVTVEEPDAGVTTIILNVTREGGTLGLSFVDYNVTSANGDPVSSDISHDQVSDLYFTDGTRDRSFTITILSDNIPEITEVFYVTLTSATGGARIGDEGRAEIRIPANDKPYGTIVSMNETEVLTTEETADSIVILPIYRTGGMFGNLQVFYNVRSAVPASLDRFLSPVANQSPLDSAKISESSSFYTNDKINECAVSCVLLYSVCEAFVFDNSLSVCELYSSTLNNGNISRSDVLYYEAIPGQLESLARHLATAEQDFPFVINGNVSIPAGYRDSIISVTVKADTTPELRENFTVQLTSVSVFGEENVDAQLLPQLETTTTIISISENDSPNGRFRLHVEQLQYTSVQEPADAGSLPVTMTITRDAGSFGFVNVTWNIMFITASNADISGHGGIVEFADGDTSKTITVSVLGDTIPEADESFQVYLSNPTGGSLLSSNNETTVTIVILNNDNAAGIIALASNSRAASINEGDTVSLTVERTIGQLGRLRVNWTITASLNTSFMMIPPPNGGGMSGEGQPFGPETQFQTSSGFIIFEDGVSEQTIVTAVLDDDIPEVQEPYYLNLVSVETLSPNVGSAILDPSGNVSEITIKASDDPHGIIEFLSMNLFLQAEESLPTIVTVLRNFGSIGDIEVRYQAKSASLSSLGPGETLATAGSDFNDTIMTLIIEDEVSSKVFTAPIIDDNTPENTEVMTVELLSAVLVSDPSVIVRLGTNTSVQITIAENDSPNGRFTFQTDRINVTEDAGTVQIPVIREQGTFGGSIVQFSSMSSGFVIESQTLMFGDGENSSFLIITIIDDTIPEMDDSSPIQILSVSNGEIGDINSIEITILANDDPYGVFRFSDSSLHVSVEETVETPNNNNIASLTVTRNGGAFGTVIVPYTVEPAGASDLTPILGVIMFIVGEREKTIMLTAVADIDPELDETYSVTLGTPSNGGRLDNANFTAMITILANQDPYGVFELYIANGLSSVSVEEDVGGVALELRRSTPSFDNISVIIEISSDSAFFNESNSTGDYTPIRIPIIVEANVNVTLLTLFITDDNIPELNESLTLSLTNVSSGAIIGDHTDVSVTILTNDNAYGIIGFEENSLSVVVNETGSNVIVTLVVERLRGLFGNVTAAWEVDGDHDVGEVTPLSGMVSFVEGQQTSNIFLTISPDTVPELNEITMVTLTQIIDNGVPMGGDETKGATLNPDRTTAVVTVAANDDPHGVVVWSVNVTEVEESEGNNIVSLTLLREFGSIGDISISYITKMDNIAPTDQKAAAGTDYVTVSNGMAFMSDRQTSTTINITVLPDNIPELTEYFLIKITNVQLVNESDRQGSNTNSPRTIEGETETRVDILENDYPQGLLNIISGPILYINENVGTLCIEVSRIGGLFNQVGTGYMFQDGTATGKGVDYASDPGIITFGPGETLQCIYVNITNDLTAEIDETFTVTISGAIGGVVLGTNSSITVTILKNDDINGVFTFSSNSLVLILPEGNTASLNVQRSVGTVGVSIIYWAVEQDGWNDLIPTSGNLTFQNGQSQGTFQIEAIHDGLPELFESYTVSLTTITGGGRISDPRTSSLAIPASDDPSGVIAIDKYPLDTIIVQEGDSFTVRILRYAGLFGSVSVQWQITPADTSAFSLTTGSVFFAENVNVVNLTIQTLQDSNPEVAKLYELGLVAAGEASINTSAADVQIIIPASDNVHGVISFSSLSTSVSEDVGNLDITVSRGGGVVGDLLVNFTVEDRTAIAPNDYQINNSYVIISDGSNSATITATIIDDTIPELDELFVVTLTAVTLTNDINGGRNFDFSGDESLIDSLPLLGLVLQFDATISQNDDANGIINLASSSYEIIEGATVSIDVQRTAGTFGGLSIHFTLTAGTALGNGIDYISPSSPVAMAPGQSSVQISISTVNDVTPELQEYFTLTLTSVAGGATLGSVLTTTIIIAPNDNPNGRVRFTASDVAGRVIANPTDAPSNVQFEVLRLDGNIGSIDVTYEVTGPVPGMEREDILQSTLQGVLTFADQQTNQFLTITVLTSDGPEPEENFTIALTAATKGVAIDEEGQYALLTVSQRGIPYGVIGFYGVALSVQETEESVNLTLPLIRNEGTFESSEVFFTVSGASPSMDVYPTSGSVTFNEGDVYSSINLLILSDQIPELDEFYTVTLTHIVGKAILNTNAVTSSFKIIANDSPYGTFGIADLSLQLVYSGENIVRRLAFTLSRGFGTEGTVDVIAGIRYEEDPNAGYYPSVITRTFTDGQTSSFISLDSTTDAFLAAGAILNVSVLSVTLTSGASNSNVLPEVSPFTGTNLHVISENVSNPSIGFSANSISALSIDGQEANNVMLTVQRLGLEGNIQVTWSTGFYLDGVVNGTFTPSTGTFFMGAGTKQKLLNFTATPTDPPSTPEVFAARLAVESLSPLIARVRNDVDTAIVEPWGVIKLTYNSYSAIEGQTVAISVSRIFGSTGDIVVSGVAKAASPDSIPDNEVAADPIIDYPLTTLTVTLADKVTSGNILIVLPYNTGTNPLKIFAFSLTGITRLNQQGTFSTPRLATPIQDAIVTIIDAEGGAGIFGFSILSATIQEDGSPLVKTTIKRTVSTVGVVSVQLSISESRADGSKPVDQIASASSGDYDPQSLVTLVTFENGESEKSVTIQILNDNIPELEEYFTIHLENPQGGKAVISSTNSTFEVGIVANDNQGGVFSLTSTSLTLDEDNQPTGTLTISRAPGLFGTITINWQTSYPAGGTHPVALGDLLVEDASVVTFDPEQTEANFTLRLTGNTVPATGDTFLVRIFSDEEGIDFGVTMATITAIPSGFSIYQFQSGSRNVVATTLSRTLTIERVQGIKLASQIRYSTVQPTEPVTVGLLTFEPAQASIHYTSINMANVLFDVNVRNVTVRLTLISTDTIPRAFYVDLEAIGTDRVQSERAVVVINAAGTQSDLYRHYFNALGSSVSSLTSIANDLQTKLSEGKISGTDSTLSTIMKYTIEEIIDTVVQSGSSYPQSLQTAMATIFDLIIRNNTYSGQFKYLITLKSFAHSLLTGKSCDETSVTISEVSYIIRSTRYRPTSLRGLTLSGGGRDYIRLPNTSSLVIAADCIDLHFIEFSNPSLYSTPVLGSKVMVLSLQNPSTSTLTTPITYRVYSTNGDVFPSDNNCLIWQYPTGDSGVGYWDSSVCTLAQTSILEQDHVECQCRSVGDYSVAIPPSYGWTIPGPISCGFVVLVMILVILIHVIYFRRIQLGTRIFIFLCVSIAIFQLLALIDMVIGPNVSTNGCVALGVLVQFAIISVFTWMFILVVSLWMNLMGFTDGREPLIVYIFVSWGLAFAIIIATILIGLYGLSWQWSQLYGKVGDLCFMPSAGAAGISTAVPILLALLVGVGMLSHSCFYWSRWEDIKSLYKDTYNKREIPLLLVFLSLVVITTVFGALHLYLQEIYLFFLFFGFNVLQGIYAIVVYIGMSCHTLTWKHKHYHIKEEVEPISIPEEPDFLSENTPSMYGSQQSLIPRSQSLMTDQRLESQVRMTAPIEMSPLRTGTVSSHSSHRHERQRQKGSQRGQSPPPLEDVPEEKGGDSDSEGAGSYAIAPDSDAETESHMDDLMFALKTGITYSQDDADSQPLIHEMESLPRKKPSASEQYRLRRISIADTHL